MSKFSISQIIASGGDFFENMTSEEFSEKWEGLKKEFAGAIALAKQFGEQTAAAILVADELWDMLLGKSAESSEVIEEADAAEDVEDAEAPEASEESDAVEESEEVEESEGSEVVDVEAEDADAASVESVEGRAIHQKPVARSLAKELWDSVNISH